MRIPRSLFDDIVSHAMREFPIEACGILGGKGGLVSEYHPIPNLKASPEYFLMDPRRQIAVMRSLEERGLELLAFFHSHPHGPAAPSAEDIRLAFYPEVATLIISLADAGAPVLRAFRIINGRSLEIGVEVCHLSVSPFPSP